MQSIERNNLKKNIVLFNPPLYFSGGMPQALDVSVPPLGILYLASYINKHSSNFNPIVIDVAVEKLSLSEIAKRIDEIKPFSVGISSMTPQLQGCVELAEFLKNNIRHKLKIFLGGPHISADPDFINRFSDIFDYAITGEAEKTFLESLEKLLNGTGFDRVQSGEAVMDLDTIPFPNRDLINRRQYKQRESMIFSRGCPYFCYYCSRPSISRKVRYRSVNNLIEEIKSVYKYCDGKIDFQDDTFTLDKSHVLEFCNIVQKDKLRLEWRCNSRIDLVDESLLGAMKKAGCSLIHFGIESGNEKVRKDIVNKGGFTNKRIYEVFEICKRFKIKIAGYFMVGHPGETKQDLEDTKRMIFDSGLDLCGASIPTPFPGSKLYDIAMEKGIINEQIIDQFARKKLGEGYTGNYPVFIPEQFSKEYLFSVMKDVNRKFYINFRTFWRTIQRDIFSLKNLKKDAIDLMSLVLDGVSSRKPYKNKRPKQ